MVEFDTQQERIIFSENLALLLKGIENITDFCAEIGIARAQLARFLDGSSHPKLHVLSKICKYFDLDARILLEPISIIETSKKYNLLLGSLMKFDKTNNLSTRPENPPDGMYLLWKESVFLPGKFACLPAIIKTDNNQKIWKCYEPWRLFQYSENFKSLKKRLINGYIFEQQRGFNMLEFTSGNNMFCYSFFYPLEPFTNSIYKGCALVGRRPANDVVVFHQIILEMITGTRSEILKETRKRGYYNLEELPKHISSNFR